MAKQDIPWGPVIIVGGGLIFFNQLKNFFGFSVREENNQTAQQTITANYFDPKFWRTGGDGTLILKQSSAEKFAKQVKDAKGILWDDQDELFAVFKSMKTKSQVSYLSMVFSDLYKKDLPTYILGNNLDTEGAAELVKIKSIVDPLPKYKV